MDRCWALEALHLRRHAEWIQEAARSDSRNLRLPGVTLEAISVPDLCRTAIG